MVGPDLDESFEEEERCMELVFGKATGVA